MTAREPLPNRRESDIVTRTFTSASGASFTLDIGIGFDAERRPKEVFATGPKEGSDMLHILSDACVVISIALQHGVAPAALRHSLGQVPAWVGGQEGFAPASPIGVIVAALCEVAG